jgi:hypothetical protein
VAGGATAFHLATANIYSYHRDEMYYLASGRRLAWGYVDHPPLTPLLYRVSDNLFGSSPFALHIAPALLSGVIVLLTARLAAELGGGRRAQLIAALGAATVPMFLTIGHFLATVTMEVVLWAVAVLLVVRILKGGDRRLWLAVGLVLGAAMLDKWTTVLLVAGLGGGLLLTPARRVLASPWTAAGAAIAAAVWLPNLLWQANHGWPQFTVAGALRNYGDAVTAAPYQFVLLGAVSVILALPGFLWLLRAPAARPFRPLGLAFVVIVVIVMVTGGKPYYAAVYAPVLIAAGAASGVGADWPAPAWILGLGVLFAPLAMPLLPLRSADSVRRVNKDLGEMTGWPHVVDVVEGVYRQHPGATIFTANYSEAGILELLGPARGLPQPISGHNSYWYWGHPRGRSDETIIVGFSEPQVGRWWGDVQLAATIHIPGGVHNQEDGSRVWIGRQQRVDWDRMWPQTKHFQ